MVPRFLRDHTDYVNDDFPNPPVTMIFLAPFARLSAANAQFLWVCGKAIMVAGIFLLGRRMVRAAGVELTGPAILLILAVWLWAVIGVDGRPRDLWISRSAGLGLDENSLETVRTWRFEPGTKNGRPVPVRMYIEVNFHLL